MRIYYRWVKGIAEERNRLRSDLEFERLRSAILKRERDAAVAACDALAFMVPDRREALDVIQCARQISRLDEVQP